MIDRLWNDIEILNTNNELSKDSLENDVTINKYYFQKIDTKQKFENYIVGKTNVKAHNLTLTCALNPGIVYNPLFIYGKSGMGKTHLLNAIAYLSISENTISNIAIIDGIKLKDCIEKYVKEGRLNELTSIFNDLDMLLIDDIQFIANNSQTQEVLVNIFDNMLHNNKQIIVTADKYIKDIKGIEDKLVTRLVGGLVTRLLTLDYKTATNIIKSKIKYIYGFEISDDVVDYLATNFANDVRTLEGALNRLFFYSLYFANDGGQITLELAKKAFKDICDDEK